MNCEDVQSLLIDTGEACDAAARRQAMEHLAGCEQCRDAQFAAGMLRAERAQSIPPPSPGAYERAIAAATRRAPIERVEPRLPPPAHRKAGFWAGLAVGSASMATAAAAAWLAFVIRTDPLVPAETAVPVAAESTETATTPHVRLALFQPQDVSISVDAPSALQDAEIRVVLTGAISLDGFEDRRELRWHTNLEAGANQLTLPVVATGESGGQLLVEVQHGQKRRTFVVDVRGA